MPSRGRQGGYALNVVGTRLGEVGDERIIVLHGRLSAKFYDVLVRLGTQVIQDNNAFVPDHRMFCDGSLIDKVLRMGIYMLEWAGLLCKLQYLLSRSDCNVTSAVGNMCLTVDI